MGTGFQTYVDDSLIGSGHIDHAGIYSLTDEVFWALSAALHKPAVLAPSVTQSLNCGCAQIGLGRSPGRDNPNLSYRPPQGSSD